MRDLGNGMDVDRLRQEREARMNPPSFEPGQGSGDDDFGWLDDMMSDSGNSSDSMDMSAFSGSSMDGMSSFDSFGSSMQQNNNVNQQQKQGLSDEEIFDKGLEVVKTASKETFGIIKTLYLSIKSCDAIFWASYGRLLFLVGAVISGVSAVLWILGIINPVFAGFRYILISGLLSVSMGLLAMALSIDKSRKLRAEMEEDNYGDDYNSNESYSNEDSWGSDDDSDEGSGWDFNDEYEDEEEYDDSSYGWANIVSSDEIEDDDDNMGGYQEDINIDAAIESIREIPPHTQTRQYLYEEYTRVLPLVNPDFAEMKEISEDSDNFIIFDKILRDAAIQVGAKEDKIPELIELRENQFIIQIKATRPSGLKENDIANEIANIYSKDDYGKIVREGVYATISPVGSSYIINIFKGENSLVTLADTYREVKDFILDPSIKKPVVMGVNELGDVWKFDAEKVFSYIISGKPRSGKSWSVVALVLQLCMYSSPREVTFEVFDVKGTSSDYYTMVDYIPHFRKFESKGKAILQRLRYLTTVEADRRKKILNENNCIAIADLKNKGVDVDIPYLYVLIDEIVGLIGTFTKEEHAEFKDLVNVLITQMPNLGIRLILIPHRVTNDIVPKTTYTNVGCMACVRSDVKELTNTLDITKKDFPYDLSNTGDMALKTGEVNKGKTVFCHGVAVSTSNAGNVDIYRFIGSLWNRLEPQEVENDGSKTSKKVEEYKGHELSGVSNIEEEEFDLNNDSSEDFWNEILG